MPTSTLEHVYRRIVASNQRLKQLRALHAPDIVIRNEHRVLRAAFHALAELDKSFATAHDRQAGSIDQQPGRPQNSLGVSAAEHQKVDHQEDAQHDSKHFERIEGRWIHKMPPLALVPHLGTLAELNTR